MRFLPSYQAVQNMANGMNPQEACENAILRIVNRIAEFQGGLVCVNKVGEHGAAAHGFNFSYSIRNPQMDSAKVIRVDPVRLSTTKITNRNQNITNFQ